MMKGTNIQPQVTSTIAGDDGEAVGEWLYFHFIKHYNYEISSYITKVSQVKIHKRDLT